MHPPTNSVRSSVLDLELLEEDPAPVFIVKSSTSALPFDFLYSNEAFRRDGLRDAVLDASTAALLFRSWAQASSNREQSQHTFSSRIWSFTRHGKHGTLKLVRAIACVLEEKDQQNQDESGRSSEKVEEHVAGHRSAAYTRSKAVLMDEWRRRRPSLLQKLPHTNLDAWEVIQAMMEMSDVGVFEYDAEGQLVYANDAWYRLRFVNV
jgi:PAS domain-containing protein